MIENLISGSFFSYDFNEEGKIYRSVGYGDFSGLMNRLMSTNESTEAMAEEGA
jgi:predicted acetyltransferase